MAGPQHGALVARAPHSLTPDDPDTPAAPSAARLDANANAAPARPHAAADSEQRQQQPHEVNASLPVYIPRWHVRAPSTALTLQTDLPPSSSSTAHNTPANASTMAAPAATPDALRSSATAPIAIQDGFLRSAWSTHSLAGSLSPSSAMSSPALNALGDLTPLPSPLVMSDSPGPWHRAVRPRGASYSRDDSLLFMNRGTLSPSNSLKKKSYQRLKMAVDASAATVQEAARERNRSISEYTPDSPQHPRPRNVTIGNAPDADASTQQRLRREQYLAANRGIVSSKPSARLPTPPASNASTRSVTDDEDVIEDDKINYIAVRHDAQPKKKLWRPVRQLGQGTFSKVYLATCERTAAKDPLDEKFLDLRKLVAIKVVEHGPAGGADEERVELSLKREVEMLRSVSHPSLVHLRAFDHNEAQALLVLTYCPGGDLFDVASDHRDILTVNLVQRIFAEMVSAVRYLHDKLIVHRDIKLESIALRPFTCLVVRAFRTAVY
jgi:protein-serine/threonine kinase